jgi:hypothetical protein
LGERKDENGYQGERKTEEREIERKTERDKQEDNEG